MSRLTLAALCAAAVVFATPSIVSYAVPITADAVVSYVQGTPSTIRNNPAVALGNLTGDTTYGGLTPFNPAFDAGQIVVVGDGGSLTLHLSNPIPANGINLGVYSNVGLNDDSPDGSGLTDALGSTVGQISRATVSVSQDGVNFILLNGGAPVVFANPTNYYLNAPINTYLQTIPASPVIASQSKPYIGSSSFVNVTYDQLKSTFNGSAGGTWIDLRGSVPVAVNYVKFDVAAGSGDRMVVDAIGGLGAVNTLTAGGRVISESVGSGAHTSDIVIDFGPQSYDFKVHYDGSITGEQALQILQANSDFRFSVHTYSFGDLVSGLDFGGYVDTGLGNNGNDYWAYYTGNGTTWQPSGRGAGTRVLTDGSYDGWVWDAAHAGGPNFATVPEPATGMIVTIAGLILLRRKR